MTKKRHDLVSLLALLSEWLGDLDISIRYSESVSEFDELMTAAGKLPPHPMFDPAFFDFRENDAGGILAYMNGKCVGGIGAYFYDLGDRTLGRHMQSSYLRLYGEDHGHVMDPAPVIADTIRGPTVYLAEFFLEKAPVGPRGIPGVSGAILLYIQALSALFWRPNWIHAFVREEDGNRSKPCEYGFTTIVPCAQIWSDPPERRFSTEYFVANDLRTLEHIASRFVRDPEILHRFLTPDSSAR
ncbi:hypothetical protein [Pacificoceanicola onchidii]|uniref:hypothetical protein n=1 Tax=Pacificoceanicola onchidii TaxID=2562685 RepID=UPI0010A4E60A|nr:hypothetical protein [Pacificoceanicola onchidii]